MKYTFGLVDRTGWAPGPWDGEPDRVDFRAHGFPCFVSRHLHFGNLCGYVAVPPDHPLHGVHYGDVDLSAHGGITYSNKCQGHICHVPEPGEPDDVWWFGFDCGHTFDLHPGRDAKLRSLGAEFPSLPSPSSILVKELFQDRYRTLEYVLKETEALAQQLAEKWPPK